MDYKANQKKANRILYMTVVIILCVMAIIVGITSTMQRRQKPPVIDTDPVTTQPTDKTTNPADTKPVDSETQPLKNQDPEDEPAENQLPSLIMPVKGPISKMHDENTPVYSITMEDWRVHIGVDIASTLGQAVLATADGVIAQVYEDPLMGTCIVINHSGDAVSIYKNLDPVIPEGIAEGVSVKSGQTIGSIGESAHLEIAEEPHVHYELKIGGKWVDPLDYFPASDVAANLDTAYEG